MKKFLALLSLCALIVLNFTACTVKEQIDLIYGEEYQIQNEKLEKYDVLEWASSDTTIAEVQDGQITAIVAGTALVTAKANDKEVAEFTVKVSTIPITAIILSSKAGEVTEGETFKLGYTLAPENASEIGLTWKSADEKVAAVDTAGVVTGIAPGQTTILLSTEDGIIDTCSVTVTQKPAYERLSDDERAFLDVFLGFVDNFKNPSSIIIKGVQNAFGTTWIAEVSAQNGYGGNGTTRYWIDESIGIWDVDDLGVDFEYEADPSYNVELLNEALKERQ